MKYRAYNENEIFAEAETLESCIAAMLEKVSDDDIIDWKIWIDRMDDEGEWLESFNECDVYDMAVNA